MVFEPRHPRVVDICRDNRFAKMGRGRAATLYTANLQNNMPTPPQTIDIITLNI